ncbi:MAG: efflux RND transporter periplasmic adaptor subunit [Anaerolineales bacterium]
MENKLPPIPVRIAILVVVLGAIAFFGFRSLNTSNSGAITASGSIEGTIVNIAPEMSGKVSEVLVDEGQAITKDEVLLSLDPSLLTAQKAVASAQVDTATAALASAQNQYDLAVQAALTSQQTSQAKDWRVSAPDEFNQPAWYFEQGEQLTAAQTEVDAAKTALDEAVKNLETVSANINNANFIAAETRLANARAAFLVADTVKTNADYAVENGGLQSAADDSYNDALDELRNAQDAYNEMLTTSAATDVQDARGKLVVAQQRYDAAYARYVSLQTGLNSPAVVTAGKALEQAKSALTQAQANLALIETQLAKLSIKSPLDGVVLTRNVEPGEFVQPGATALTIADLSQITITVYVPEDRYGQISLGQKADVSVDSFPGETFTASVVLISDQAEFTPRNVQTVEGRSSTFYAIKLKVEDPEGKLKIGMPADVLFK